MGSSVIGALRVNLGMDTAQFEQGAAKAQKTTKGLQGALGGFASSFGAVASGAAIGTAAVAAFTGAMKLAGDAATFADDLSAAATKLGVTAEALQALRFAAQDADIPVDQFDASLGNLNATLGALKSGIGDGRIRAAFEALGIPTEQLKSMHDASDLLPVLADHISKVGSQAEQVQIAKKLGVEDLLPLLQRGADGIRALTDQARDLGLVIDEQVVNRLADMSRQMEIADARAQAAGRGLGASFTPALVVMKEKTADAVKWLDQLIDRFNKLPNRSMETLDRQLSEKRDHLRQQVIHGAGDSGQANYLRGEIAKLEEAKRNNERARKAAEKATPPPVATGNGGGSGGSGCGSSGRKIGAYSTYAGALKWLKQRNCDSLEAYLDALGLLRISPASALVGDILTLGSSELLSAPVIYVGDGRYLGFHEDSACCELLKPTEFALAWKAV